MGNQKKQYTSEWTRPAISEPVLRYITKQLNENKLSCEYLDGFKKDFQAWMEKEHPETKTIFWQYLHKFLGYYNHYVTGLKHYYEQTHKDSQKTLF